MAFLFPKLFPGCVTTGGLGVNLTLVDAMALYWKPVSLQLQATCNDLGFGGTFSINETITNTQTLGDLVCGNQTSFNGVNITYFYVGPNAFQKGDLYMPSFLMEFQLLDAAGFGRICVADTSQSLSSNGSLSFLESSIPVTFFDDDDPGRPHSGSGSLTIVAERTFE
jgi:hypothetical protein